MTECFAITLDNIVYCIKALKILLKIKAKKKSFLFFLYFRKIKHPCPCNFDLKRLSIPSEKVFMK